MKEIVILFENIDFFIFFIRKGIFFIIVNVLVVRLLGFLFLVSWGFYVV